MPANCRNISDEVYPGILIGDKSAATNISYLTKTGVTHVINTAEDSVKAKKEKYLLTVKKEYRRSSTIVIAYLMIKKNMTAVKALLKVNHFFFEVLKVIQNNLG